MSAVDVLAAMQEAIDFIACRVSGNSSMLADISEARAAVAELIAADREYDEALRLANIGYGSTDEDRAAQQRLSEAIAARSAALANIGAAP